MAAKDGARFDFIVVVGGGTAGNIVAARLAENPKRQDSEIRTPGRAMEIRGSSQYDWGLQDDHGVKSSATTTERIEKPNTRGKALGGSSSLNYFSWVPGSKGTFDMWEEYRGKEWCWNLQAIVTAESILGRLLAASVVGIL
ncbi:glucose-methanol-choline oxidoreductase, partial [Metarhizium majus ARSEF 297]